MLMKRTLFVFSCLINLCLRSQCSYSCSSYSVSPITYSFIEVEGNPVYLQDDDISTTVPLNFNFDFYCTTQNQVRIGSNGYITFDFGPINLSLTPMAQKLPDASKINDLIAWNWNDLDPSTFTGGGSITYTTLGVSPNQKFVVTYSAVPMWTNNAAPSQLINTGQIILYETSNIIEIHLKETNNNGWLTHTEGIEDVTGTLGVPVPGRNQTLWKASHSAHMFAPFSVSSTVSASGTPSLCQGTQGQFSVNASPPPQYYTWIFPTAWSGGGNGSTVNATVASAGVVSVVANYTCGASEQATLFVNAAPAPTIAFSAVSPTNLCAGTPFNITANGALTYSLNPGNFSGGSTFTAMSTTSGVYTLSGTNSAGCRANNKPTVTINVKPAPTVTVNSGEICLGGSFVITPSGAFSYEYINGFQVMSPTAPGIYSIYVVGTGTNFCKGPPAVSVLTVNALPVIKVVSTKSLICRGESTTLTASGALSYQWQHNGSAINPTIVSPTLMTIYAVSGTDTNDCVNKGSVSVLVSSCVGIEEAGVSRQEINLYPNPASNSITIQTADNSFSLELRDILGRIILSRNFEQSFADVDVSALPSGTYSYSIKTPGGLRQGKLIKR